MESLIRIATCFPTESQSLRLFFWSAIAITAILPSLPWPWISPVIFLFWSSLSLLVLTSYGPLIISVLKVQKGLPPPPPGSLGVPFLGESLGYLRSWSNKQNPDVWYDVRRAKHGNVFKTHLFGCPTVVMLGPHANKFIFTNDNKLFHNSWPDSVKVLEGRHSAPIALGAPHKRIRRVLHTVLGTAALKGTVATLEKLLLSSLHSRWTPGESILAFNNLKDLTLFASAEFFMNFVPGEEMDNFKYHFRTLTAGLMSLAVDLPWTVFGRAKRARKVLMKCIHEKIQSRKNLRMSINMNNDGPCINDVFDRLLSAEDENGGFTDEEIADNLLVLLMAGEETTSSTLSMILKYLALNPIIRDKLRRECRKVADLKKGGEPLTWEEIKGIEYLRNVVSEALRMYPPVNGGFRLATGDIVYGGYTIPKGWKVHYSLRQTQINEEHFPNPTKFDPDRFNNPHDPFSFLPFGQGNRICAGNEFAMLLMEIFLYHLVLKYDWDLMDPKESVMMYFFPTPANGLPLLLKQPQITSI